MSPDGVFVMQLYVAQRKEDTADQRLFFHVLMNLCEHRLRAIRIVERSKALNEHILVSIQRIDRLGQGLCVHVALDHYMREPTRLERVGV